MLKVDVWAYGCTLIELATGNPPNATTQVDQVGRAIRAYGPPRLDGERFSTGLCDLVSFVIRMKATERPSMAQILEHQYLAGTETDYPMSSLSELVEKYYRWEAAGGQRSSLFVHAGAAAPSLDKPSGAEEEEWNFSTTSTFEQLHAMRERESAEGAATPTNQLRSLRSLESSSDPFFNPSLPDPMPVVNIIGASPTDEYTGLSFSNFSGLEPEPASHGMDLTERAMGSQPGDRAAGALQSMFEEPAEEPASDLPLRSGESSTTHQEVQYQETIPVSSPMDLANVPRNKVDKANKRKTMEWQWPTAGSSSQENESLPVSRPQPQRGVTTPVPAIAPIVSPPPPASSTTAFRPISATLDLDALMDDPSPAVSQPTSIDDSYVDDPFGFGISHPAPPDQVSEDLGYT